MPTNHPSSKPADDIIQNDEIVYLCRKFECDIETVIRQRVTELLTEIFKQVGGKTEPQKSRVNIRKKKFREPERQPAASSDKVKRAHKKHRAAIKRPPINPQAEDTSSNILDTAEPVQPPVRLEDIMVGPGRDAIIEELALEVSAKERASSANNDIETQPDREVDGLYVAVIPTALSDDMPVDTDSDENNHDESQKIPEENFHTDIAYALNPGSALSKKIFRNRRRI